LADTQPKSGQVESAFALTAAGGETLAVNGVEFALVLARMIESVRTDPEQMRNAIYDLARHKLDEQLGRQAPEDIRKIKESLEIAIQGVELFFHKNDQQLQLPPPSAHPLLPPAAATGLPRPALIHPKAEKPDGDRKPTGWKWSAAILLTLTLVLTGLAGLRTRPDLLWFNKNIEPQQAVVSPSAQSERGPESQRQQLPDPLTPPSYGIYAISEGRLVELKLLPIRAPDLRVAISASIESSSQSSLPGGKVRFVVYRREPANGFAERAEVRVVARVIRTTSYDTVKPKITDDEQKWVIRNISFAYRIAPSRDRPEMDEITSEAPDAELPSGRYALVLNKQAYDFTVEGPLTDPQHCLEQVTAANGTFYAQCTLKSLLRR
jgi:hypothetical protein